MSLNAYLDTNVTLWLMQGDRKQISREAKRIIDRSDLLISPMVALELEYLYELRRSNFRSLDIQMKLAEEIGLRICTLPFDLVAQAAIYEAWTRDPFDRLIVAHAKANGMAHLISSDETMKQHYPRTIW